MEPPILYLHLNLELLKRRIINLNDYVKYGFLSFFCLLCGYSYSTMYYAVSFRIAKYWALRAMKWFKLEGFLILRSSENNYHVLFDRPVSWSENIRIVAWFSLLSNNPTLQKYHLMQCIKEGSTLRVSPKGEKPCPRIVFRSGKQDKQIKDFLKMRKLIKKILKKCFS